MCVQNHRAGQLHWIEPAIPHLDAVFRIEKLQDDWATAVQYAYSMGWLAGTFALRNRDVDLPYSSLASWIKFTFQID